MIYVMRGNTRGRPEEQTMDITSYCLLWKRKNKGDLMNNLECCSQPLTLYGNLWNFLLNTGQIFNLKHDANDCKKDWLLNFSNFLTFDCHLLHTEFCIFSEPRPSFYMYLETKLFSFFKYYFSNISRLVVSGKLFFLDEMPLIWILSFVDITYWNVYISKFL